MRDFDKKLSKMIDAERRKKLALHLRHLAAGVISNDEFEENILDDVTFGWLPEQYYRSKKSKIDDPIIIPILEMAWGLYDDTRNHKIKLEKEALKFIARVILFLHSEKEYEWPHFDDKSVVFNFSIMDIILTFITFGQHYRTKKATKEVEFEIFKSSGDYDVWPFIKKSDFENEKRHHPFLYSENLENHA